MADRALAMARRVGDPVALASVLSAHGWTVVGPERRRDRLLVADDLLRLADVSPSAECEGHVLRFVALVESGEVHAADAALAKARATARVPMSHWMVLLWESAREVLAGRLANAEELAGRAAEVGRDGGFQPSVVEFTFVGILLCIRLAQGRVSELEAVTAGARTLPNRPAWSFTTEAQVALARGDRDAARGAMAHAVERGLLTAPRNHAWGTTVIGAADVCADLDDRSLAGPLYELLAPHTDLMVIQSGPLSRVVGRLALTLGRRDEAQHHLRGAIALCERMDARAFLAIARHDLGRLLLPSHEGAVLIEQARAAAEALGMPGWAKKARAATASATVHLRRD
jgi:hypothetical protein